MGHNNRNITFWFVLLKLWLILFSCNIQAKTSTEHAQVRRIPSEINIKFRNIEHEKFVEIGQIWAIAEDQQGFIWVSGARGAARFDGVNLKIFQNKLNDPFSIPEGYISDLLRSQDGKLWLASHGGLLLFEPENEHFVKQPLILPQGEELSAIWTLTEGNDGSIWIGSSGKGIGRFDPRSGEYHQYQQPDTIQSKQEYNTYAVLQDSQGFIWSGNEAGATRLNPATATFDVFTHNASNPSSISPGTVTSICEDSTGAIWIGTSSGLNRFNATTGEFILYTNQPKNTNSLSGNNIGDIVLDKEGQLWVATDGGGLNRYDSVNNQFIQVKATKDVLGALKNNATRRLYVSDHGDLWVGYHPYGVSVSDRYATAFKTYIHNPNDSNTLSSNTINALFQPRPGELWLGTERGINFIDLKTDRITRYQHSPEDPNSLSANAVLTVLYDTSGRLWAGTWGEGLNLYDKDNDRFIHLRRSIGEPTSLPSDRVWKLKEKDKNSIWVGTERGLSLYHIDTQQFTPIEGFNNRVGNILSYDQNHILVIDDNNMRVLNTDTLKTSEKNAYWNDMPRITNAYINKIGELWVNTEHGFRRQKTPSSPIDDFPQLGEKNSQYYSQVLTDKAGTLWLGNSHGISAYNEQTERFFIFRSEHGLPGNSFRAPRGGIVLSDGRIAMGGAEGLVIFNPNEVYREELPSPPILTGLKILDQKVNIGAADSPLKKAINLAQQITLTYKQNVFSIEYSALEFQLANKTTFAFRLSGFDPKWRNVGSQRVATYTNMNPGRYIFEVKAANDQGLWADKIASIVIMVSPPWWRTKWAYGGYVLSLLFIIYLVVYVIWSTYQREHERKTHNKLKEIDRLKDDFMAKTSHELRTPLNGIIGLTEAIISGSAGPISEAASDKLRIVISSGKRLANIINDILDFSKFKTHEITLNLSQVNIHQLVESTLVLSQPLLGKKNVALINKIPKDITSVIADEQRLNQILFNLIGNAIKFTRSGQITVTAEEEEDSVLLAISDTGIGIVKEDQSRIFEPFEQAENHVGTGLGLAVTKQLVRLHGGQIQLTSTPGSGSTFSFSLPKSHDPNIQIQFETDFQTIPIVKQKPQPRPRPNIFPSSDKINLAKNKKYQILIVDDEPVNRLVLEGYLGKEQFDITEAEDGHEAIALVNQNKTFDLILLDVMMPGLTGFDVCLEVRKKYNLCELPIIFLTAKSQLKDMQKGYQVGANDFLYKPVIMEEFLAKIQIHLKISAQMHQYQK